MPTTSRSVNDQVRPLRLSALALATRVALLAGVACVIAVALLWYGTFPRVILMGDDALLVYSVLHGQYALDLPHVFGLVIAQKYRPVFHLILGLIVPVFRTNFAAYEALNLFVELLNAAVLAGIVYVLGRRNVLLAFAAAIAFVVCRFGYYNVIQLFGLMEGLGVLFMLLTVFDAARSYGESARITRAVDRLVRARGIYPRAVHGAWLIRRCVCRASSAGARTGDGRLPSQPGRSACSSSMSGSRSSSFTRRS